MSDIISLDKNDIVKKSETLLQSRFKLKPVTLKMISTLISSIKETDEPDKEYIFKIKNFAELMGSSSHKIYELLDEATEELLSKPIKIPIEGRKGFKKFNWVSKAEYRYGEGTIVFRVDQDLRPYLIEAKERYLRYRIHNILQLKSTYSIRMYEIFKDWLNSQIRYKKTKTIKKEVSVDWLRDTLEIPESYRFNDIKRVINKAQKQILDFTDISFDYEEVKKGRRVESIVFEIKKEKEDYIFGTVEQFVKFLKATYKGKKIPGTDYEIDSQGFLCKNGKELCAEEALSVFKLFFEKYSNDMVFKNLF
jgi:plasmid replication initiation protein